MSKNPKPLRLDQIKDAWKEAEKIQESYPTTKEFEEYLKDIFFKKGPKGKRRFSGARGCRTHGYVSLDKDLYHCGDKDCAPCNYFNKLILDGLHEEAAKI